ncbi:DUF2252 domain-containing protein [Lactiplantibacillus pentosus]|uniref:DUF2252 domain-containing protein n=1 Tax=Lactiplantibacillus pentosus TaxID=1589 RepID=UPI00132F6E72|nr:DUF2252 domain-containing protein [Lactiplantibacillus pentosus]MBQ0835666.1 DUF2252 domain-containing protein [Lactiplantibacillus pentosus]MBU7464118.1 DUF2252 domain-containing protein [Lactiplantibacillus pentosus]MBU7490448.1 DUF2252 domain-containing protein [Lactiplantibacillus pentosus]MBU7492107.1 DUF2252 domain-containing protein [Lactiplantibacillus pentosus]MBU7518039.1 DUF2252 domain-containing protein [Lactiplantibacillus pentosus]
MPPLDLTHIRQHHTVAELIALGKARRQVTSFEQLGVFTPVKRNAGDYLRHVREMLVPELLPLRRERMSASAFAFFRGSVELMDYDLDYQASTEIPAVVCGDAHLGNFGFYASPERRLVFDLNDFDEAGVHPWEWDLRRLLVSIFLAARDSNFKPKKVEKLVQAASASYRDALQRMFDQTTLDRFYRDNEVQAVLNFGGAPEDTADLIAGLVKKAQKRNSEQVVRKFTVTNSRGERQFKENAPRSVHVDRQTTHDLKVGIQDYLLNVRTDVALLLSQYEVTDIIRHSVGVGSFGSLCYLVLLTSTDGSHLVLQIKEALPTRQVGSRSRPALTAAMELTEGQRIVSSQRILQATSDAFLGYFQVGDKSFYVRQFRDMKESIDIPTLAWGQFQAYANTCAMILAKAHAQSPTAAMIRGYVGHSTKFDEAMAKWAAAYVTQVDNDYQDFLEG